MGHKHSCQVLEKVDPQVLQKVAFSPHIESGTKPHPNPEEVCVCVCTVDLLSDLRGVWPPQTLCALFKHASGCDDTDGVIVPQKRADFIARLVKENLVHGDVSLPAPRCRVTLV